MGPILVSGGVGGVGDQVKLGTPLVMVPILFILLLTMSMVELNQARNWRCKPSLFLLLSEVLAVELNRARHW